MPKIVYYADHKNIKGSEQVIVEQNIDALGDVSYQIILDTPYNNNNDRCKKVVGLYANINEAKKFADDYISII